MAYSKRIILFFIILIIMNFMDIQIQCQQEGGGGEPGPDKLTILYTVYAVLIVINIIFGLIIIFFTIYEIINHCKKKKKKIYILIITII